MYLCIFISVLTFCGQYAIENKIVIIELSLSIEEMCICKRPKNASHRIVRGQNLGEGYCYISFLVMMDVSKWLSHLRRIAKQRWIIVSHRGTESNSEKFAFYFIRFESIPPFQFEYKNSMRNSILKSKSSKMIVYGVSVWLTATKPFYLESKFLSLAYIL